MPVSITGPCFVSPAAGQSDGAATFHDPIFSNPATFYLFDLPFWSDLRVYLLTVVIVTILVYWLIARGWQLRFSLPETAPGLDRSSRSSISAAASNPASCAARWRSSW